MLVNYPNGTKVKQSYILHGNRGMSLEHDINVTNEYYLVHDIAVIYKKPTPITVVKVDFKSRMDAVIKEAYYKTPSTTDYNGVYKGKYIDFEAKETNSKTSFPLNNLQENQLFHIKNVVKNGGISFLIISFSLLEKYYLLMGKDLIEFLQNNERKSIPLSYIEKHGHEIKRGLIPPLDYLAVLEKIL